MKAGDSTVQFSDLFPTEYRAFYRGALSVCVEHFGGIDSKKSVPYSDALHPKNASCRTVSPAAVQLRKLVAAGEIPDTAYACIAVIHLQSDFSSCILADRRGRNDAFCGLQLSNHEKRRTRFLLKNRIIDSRRGQ